MKSAIIKSIDDHLEDWLMVLLLASMSLLICFQVFMRYAMRDSLAWSEELARYMFIWVTYIGASYGVKCKAHVGVSILTARLSIKWRHLANILASVLFLVFALIVVSTGAALSQKVLKLGQVSSSLGIPMAYVYLGPVIGFLLIAYRLVQIIFLEIKMLKAGK